MRIIVFETEMGLNHLNICVVFVVVLVIVVVVIAKTDNTKYAENVFFYDHSTEK